MPMVWYKDVTEDVFEVVDVVVVVVVIVVVVVVVVVVIGLKILQKCSLDIL
jgi:hypothetical protein